MILQGVVLPRKFYVNETLSVAQELLGCTLVVLKEPMTASQITKNGIVTIEQELIAACGDIVECEAYLGKRDRAAHSYKAHPFGRTNIMYESGGYAYIYFIYGMHYCLNAITAGKDNPEGVLIRALQPILQGEDVRKYAGPGKLCKSAGIDKQDYGADLCADVPSRLIIMQREGKKTPQIKTTTRIGVESRGEAANYLYRFYDMDSPSVSKKERKRK